MKRYQGNTGQVTIVPEYWDQPATRPYAIEPSNLNVGHSPGIANPPGAAPRDNAGSGGLLGGLGNLGGLGTLLPGIVGGLGNIIPGTGEGLGGLLHGVGDGIGKIFSRNFLETMELEDLILALVLYLMYRESKDIELLFILGAMLFL